jgi:hypothetical protein
VSDGGCAGERLSAEKHGDTIQLTGRFGTFYVGDLLLAWVGEDDRDLSTLPLKRATPLAAVTLDRVVEPPPGALRAELRVLTAANGETRTLAGTDL